MTSRSSGTDIVRGWAADLGACLGFLTRLPMPSGLPFVSLADAMRAFPLAGALIGAVAGLLLAGLAALGLPDLAAAGLMLAIMALLTGGLHEDGLADTADGFGGGRDLERKLAIMRDSHIGTYGVLALVLGLLVKSASLAALAPGPALHIVALLIATGALSRAIIVWFMASTPPARRDGVAHAVGQPSDFTARSALLWGGLLAFVVLLASLGLVPALLIIGAGAAAASLFRLLSLRQIGGHSGDACGAIQFVSETAMILTAAASFS
ncbi:adenosylcobinamide-GDP ribazoletransferase [Nordella sp. HKS 07]|uniref:adenosylcobinamide-GDP ribazoletransferase n=1 Tax=Nordella sp. HKS 07 TaxID=2712222 RepID=UPI0013E1272C|nr:adenosylcobinamide-GDP ribazoletransferase [Nordella sp. HKS 07]QIG50024.1 adenosylcobinamide-GDP ribazoletransferase [Nordella sp. HKS 07]